MENNNNIQDKLLLEFKTTMSKIEELGFSIMPEPYGVYKGNKKFSREEFLKELNKFFEQ